MGILRLRSSFLAIFTSVVLCKIPSAGVFLRCYLLKTPTFPHGAAPLILPPKKRQVKFFQQFSSIYPNKDIRLCIHLTESTTCPLLKADVPESSLTVNIENEIYRENSVRNAERSRKFSPVIGCGNIHGRDLVSVSGCAD